MAIDNNRTVFPRSDGMWVNQLDATETATSIHDTEAEAVAAAREAIQHAGGGTLTILGEDNEIREQETFGEGA